MGEAKVGRRRDPAFDARIIAAAQEVYAEKGWLGFTFEAVARGAEVGKPAVYRRWKSRRELLAAAALDLPTPVVEDEGGLERELLSYISQSYDFVLGRAGRFWSRLQIDVSSFDELQGFFQAGVLEPSRVTFYEIGARAVARGELQAMPPVTFLMEMSVGTLSMRIAHSPEFERSRLAADRDRYCTRLAHWMTVALIDSMTATTLAGSHPA